MINGIPIRIADPFRRKFAVCKIVGRCLTCESCVELGVGLFSLL